jgi:hypothetical protein
MDRVYKGPKKQAVQLTSLLDLLFVMIFVSLIQQKEVTQKTPAKTAKTPVKKAKPIVTKKIKPKPVVKPVKTFYTVRATFNFYGTNSNPNIPNGSYIMSGSYDKKSGELKLGGVGWVKRPEHYDMVPLSGVIDQSQKYFKGRIQFQGCQEFILERKTSSSETPISGDWVGSYNCSQGATGLTLTVK